MAERLRVEHLYKVFAHAPNRAMAMLQTGADKDQVLKALGAVVGLDDVNLSVPAGAIYMIMGLSGSGKSTLARCINRLHDATAGQILLDGEDILTLGPAALRELRRTRVSMVFQHFALLPHRSVIENVEFGLKLRGTPKRERRRRAEEVLATVGLLRWAARRPHELSGGMRQRVGLARALATDADVLIMDEAFSALDPLIRNEMQDELLRLQRTLKKTILFITHDFQEALKLGNRIAIMAHGQVVQEGSPESIVLNPMSSDIAAFTREVDGFRLFDAGSTMESARPVGGCGERVLGCSQAQNHGAFLVDENDRVIGGLSPEALVQVRDGAAAGVLASSDAPAVVESAKLIEAAKRFRPGGPVAVVDAQGRLVGVLSADRILARIASMAQASPPTERDADA